MKLLMKYSVSALCTAIILGCSIPLTGQEHHNHGSTAIAAKRDMSVVMGATTVDTTIEGVHVRLWLITQRQHTTIMEGKKGAQWMGMERSDPAHNVDPTQVNMTMGEETRAAMTAGTHLVLIDVTDSLSGNELVGTSAKLLIYSPAKKRSTVELLQVMNHFALGIFLREKGTYRLTLDVNANGISRTKQFTYVAP